MAIEIEAGPTAALMEVANAQFGVFTRAQAVRCGFSSAQITRRCRVGLWESILPAVFRVRGSPPSWECRAMAALLWAGKPACLSHRSAARVWGLSGFQDAGIDITAPSRVRGVEWVRLHVVPASLRHSTRDGLRVTGVARTLLDLSSVCSTDSLEGALDESLRKRLVSLKTLDNLLRQEGPQGRKGAGTLRLLVERRDPSNRPTDSQLETLTLSTIRKAGLPLPEQQKVIKDRQGTFARVDFIYVKDKVIIEVDGFAFHSSARDWSADMARRNRLTKMGWRVFHVTYWNLKEDPGDLTDWLGEILTRSSYR